MTYNKKNNKRILYLGLDPERFRKEGEVVHLPVIRTVARSLKDVEVFFKKIELCSFVLFTSRTPVSIFFDYASQLSLSLVKKKFIVIGKATESKLKEYGFVADFVATEETGEGVIELLKKISFEKKVLFFPHSSSSREVIFSYLAESLISNVAFPLYDTRVNQVNVPDLETFDEIVFTSPSTVKAFFEISSIAPPLDKCRTIGPITQAYLMKKIGEVNTHF